MIAPKACIRIDVDPGYYTLNYYNISLPNMRSELAPNFTKRYRLNAGDKRFILVKFHHGITVSGTDVSGEKGFKELTSVIDFAPMLKKREYEDSVKRAIMQQSLQIARLPQNEPTTQVEGLGTTALEQTIVRWEIQSRPLGADIFWRVVSKTPDVKSTNNKYLTTTPYEATKTLDIKGLTYQTAGDVRIILRCEKEGYYAQEKEFNVRMVLDQEEISAFFRLVKEETATE